MPRTVRTNEAEALTGTRAPSALLAPLLGLLSVLVLLPGCIDDTAGASGQPQTDTLPARTDSVTGDGSHHGPGISSPHGQAPWAIAVVGTDYFSTSISIVERETRTLFRENVVHSGSSAPGLSVALSGDVVLPRVHNERNWIVLMDRYPNSVLTFVSPDDFSVRGQLSVATGFASNPHDFLWVTDDKAYVTRYERNSTPGAEPHDGGDDILVVDPVAGEVTGRIPLGEFAATDLNPRLQARPNQMAWLDSRVWVSLDHLSDDFTEAGDGRLVAIDPANDDVVEMVPLPGGKNCGGLLAVPQRSALYLSCTGVFAGGQEGQLAHSAIVEVDLSGDTPRASVVRDAADGGGSQPYGFDLDVASGRWLLAVRFGDLATEVPDRLVAVDLETGDELVVHEATSAYGLGGVLVDNATGTLYVGDADPESPALHLYDVADGAFTAAGTLDTHPTVGLPPRMLRFY